MSAYFRFRVSPAVAYYPQTVSMPPGPEGTSQVLDASLSPCQALGTPTGPRESHRAEPLDRCSCSPLAAWFPGGATISRSSVQHIDSSVLASVSLTTWPPVFLLLTRLNRFRVVQHPSGLENALSTLHRFCSPVSADTTPPTPLRQRRKTRYGWVASPCPTGTFTLQEMPSFARRDNE